MMRGRGAVEEGIDNTETFGQKSYAGLKGLSHVYISFVRDSQVGGNVQKPPPILVAISAASWLKIKLVPS